jgi:hypothetical protein
MSGDEWRISASIEFIRKGKVIKAFTASNIEYAVRLLDSKLINFGEGNGGYYGGEGSFCDQEGCSEIANVLAKKKFDWSRDGNKSESPSNAYRLFCNKHKRRGDCGLDDSDTNYDFTEYIQPKEN